MIDTHCHLTFPQLMNDLDRVLEGAADAGVDRMITIGVTPENAVASRALTQRYDHLFYTTGAHPHYADEIVSSDLPHLAQLAMEDKCVAFGEIGLDYHYDDPPRKVQHDLFNAMLAVIRYSEILKPIVIHCRKAVDDTLAMIRASGLDFGRFVFHCFTESPNEVKKVLDAGAMISFTGIVTYKNAPEVRESALLVPDDRIMVETDAPYLSPEPHRKIRPNEPKFVKATAQFLAELRATPMDTFVEQVDANAERFFGLPPERP